MVPWYSAGIDPTQPATNAITVAYVLLLELIGLAGSILLLIGLAYYAKSKGQHGAWCLLAFIPVIGLVVLAYLKYKWPVPVDITGDP